MIEEIFRIKDSIACSNCGHFIHFNDNIFKTYFKSSGFGCPVCNMGLFKMFKKILEDPVFGCHYGLLGCENRGIKIKLKPHETYTLDLSKEIGDGELLYINYTPKGNPENTVFPVELHTNTPTPHIRRNEIILYGKPWEENAEETEIGIMYWFAPENIKNDLGTVLLLDAFKRYYEENYRYMIISAFTVVEIAQNQFLSKILSSASLLKDSEEQIGSFLKNQASFAPQLKILLPFLSDKLDFPMMNKNILESLIHLMDDRNSIVHTGKPKKNWDKDKLKSELISALFAFKYYKLISPMK